jgi:hypothetical protein
VFTPLLGGKGSRCGPSLSKGVPVVFTGAAKAVRIRGYDDWTIGDDNLIAQSKGHYDEAEYKRQLKVGGAPAR